MHAHDGVIEPRALPSSTVWREVAETRRARFDETGGRIFLATSFGTLEVRAERTARAACTMAELRFPHAIAEPFELSHQALGLWRILKRPFVFDSPRQLAFRVCGSRSAARAILQSDARGALIALAEMSDRFLLSEERLMTRFDCVFDELWELERLIDRVRLVAKYVEPSAWRARAPYR